MTEQQSPIQTVSPVVLTSPKRPLMFKLIIAAAVVSILGLMAILVFTLIRRPDNNASLIDSTLDQIEQDQKDLKPEEDFKDFNEQDLGVEFDVQTEVDTITKQVEDLIKDLDAEKDFPAFEDF